MMNRISVFARRQRIKKFENYTMQALWIEAFLLALFPSFATFALMLATVTWFLRLKFDNRFKIRSLPQDLPMTLFFVLATVSVFFSPVASFDLIYNFFSLAGLYILTYFIVGQNIRTPEQIKNLVKALGASTFFVVMCGYFQYIFGVDIVDMKWIDGEVFPELRKRIFSTLENPNVLAGYLDVMICIALGLLAKFGDKKQKILLVVAVIMMTACLIMTYSRGAFLAMATVFIIYGIMQDWRVLIVFAVLTGIVLYGDSTFSERIISIFNETLDSSEGLRLGIWVSTISMIADHPFTGSGWGAFQFVYPQYNYYLADTNIIIYHAHNLYLNTAAEVGIVGALAYFWFFFGTMLMALDLDSNKRYRLFSSALQTFWENFSSTFARQYDKLIASSSLFWRLSNLKRSLQKKFSNLVDKLFAAFKFTSKDKSETKKSTPKVKSKSGKDVVHHEELNRKSRRKKSDDDDFDLQKFSEPAPEEIAELNERNFLEGLRFGIGLAFLSMALNGLSDDLLFNIQSSILMWQLGALSAVINILEESE